MLGLKGHETGTKVTVVLAWVTAVLQEKLMSTAAELEALRAESGRKLPGAGKLRKAVQERAKKIEALLARINEIEDRIFAAFSKKVGCC